MSDVNQSISPDRVVEWVVEQALRLHILVTAYPTGVKLEREYISVPVAVEQGDDAWERATLLQKIEDEWDPEAFGGMWLDLVPAKRTLPS